MRKVAYWEVIRVVKEVSKDRALHIVKSEDLGPLLNIENRSVLPIRVPFLAIYESEKESFLRINIILVGGVLFLQIDIEDMAYLVIFPPDVCLALINAMKKGIEYLFFIGGEWRRKPLRGFLLSIDKLTTLTLAYSEIGYERIYRTWQFVKGLLDYEGLE